jgi:hypothetical protein
VSDEKTFFYRGKIQLFSIANCKFFCPSFFVGFVFSSQCTTYSTTLSRLAYNGEADWRSGGIYKLPFKSALPAAVAPNRSL